MVQTSHSDSVFIAQRMKFRFRFSSELPLFTCRFEGEVREMLNKRSFQILVLVDEKWSTSGGDLCPAAWGGDAVLVC